MSHHLSLIDYVLWAAWPLLCAVVLWRSVAWRIATDLWVFHVYLLFCLLRTAILFVASFYSMTIYWELYWVGQVIGFMFISKIAFRLLGLSMPYPRATEIGAWFALGGTLLLCLAAYQPNGQWFPWIQAMKWCNVLVLGTLSYTLLGGKMTWPYREIGIGFAVSIGTHLLCSFVQDGGNPGHWLRACYQLSALSGVLIWLWVVCKTPTKRLFPISTKLDRIN